MKKPGNSISTNIFARIVPFALVGIAVMAITILARLAYKNVSNQAAKTIIRVIPTITPTPTVYVINEDSEKIRGWKTYSNKSLGFTIKYPPGISYVNRSKTWVIFADKAAIDSGAYIFATPHLQIIDRIVKEPEDAIMNEKNCTCGDSIKINNAIGLQFTPIYSFGFAAYLTDNRKNGSTIIIFTAKDGPAPKPSDFESYVEMIHTLTFTR